MSDSAASAEPRLRAALLDVDGTLTWGGEAIPGAAATLAWLRGQGIALRLITNIDSRAPATVARELHQQGIPVEPTEVFTPLVAARRFLEERPDDRCHLLLSAELRACLAAHDARGGPAQWVLVGDCREVAGFAELDAAFRQLIAGAGLLALQRGRWWRSAAGPSLDTGAFVALLEYASERTPICLGKPSPEFFQLALADLDCEAREVVVVGDDADADAAGALRIGAGAVLVRTGKGELRTPAELVPSLRVIGSVADLPRLFSGQGGDAFSGSGRGGASGRSHE